MELYIKWRYPNETEDHEHVFHDIDAETISIHYGQLYFSTSKDKDGWLFPLSHIITMERKED